MSYLTHHTRVLLLSAATATSAFAQTTLSVQSNDRPFGLDVVGLVNQAGSDADSATFQDEALPSLQSFINENLGERQALEDISAYAVNPEVLRLNTDSDVRVYFVGEGAGYHNSLGFNTKGGGISDDTKLVFPDSSSRNSYFNEGDEAYSAYMRSENNPLLPGDFVDVGTYEDGTSLDFLLIANGANGGTDVWSTAEGYNEDGIQHAVAFAVDGSPYLMLGFEDLYGGGDQDYNDLVFAVDIGEANVAFLSQPEPALGLMGLALLGFRRVRLGLRSLVGRGLPRPQL